MRIVKRSEMVNLPKGTIYFEWEPNIVGGMRRHEGSTGMPNDWFESIVGLQVKFPGYHGHLDDKYGLEINDHSSRQGTYWDEELFIVLDPEDVETVIKQLRGESLDPNDERSLVLED